MTHDKNDPFGTGSPVVFVGPKKDWRDNPDVANETDPDDELLSKTPEDVVAILGFDPLDADTGDEDDGSNI